jgi:methyl-accepting chemotaxis protein
MNKFLNNLSIRTRMLMSVSLFLVTLLYSMYSSYQSIGANIDFAVQEKKGDLIQRPLSTLLHDTAKLRFALVEARGGVNSAQDIKELLGSIDKGMGALGTAYDAVGADLQFTDAGLKSRGRESFKYEVVLQQWQDTKKAIMANIGGENDVLISGTIAGLRGMIAHSGDTSNLILDPDLDSYYFMDVTLVTLPQTFDRLSVIGTTLYPQLSPTHIMTAEEKTEAAVMARLLAESDVARVNADLDTALKEDANFHGVSARLQKKIPSLLAVYNEKNGALVDLLKKTGAGAPPSVDEFKQALAGAEDSGAFFLTDGFDELDALLDLRIADYRYDQISSILTSVAGIIISMLFYLLVVRSLTRPLQDLTDTMGKLAEGNSSVEVPYSDAKSEIGRMAVCLQVFKKNAIEKTEMEKAQIAAEERMKAEDRKAEMEKIASSFESRVKTIIKAVSVSASSLSGTANNMAGFVGQSSRSAKDASSSANQTSQNMQSVAAAAEEMAVTIQEISSQIQRTNQFIADSVQKANGADQYAISLKDASQKVRDVTQLIAEIASQTNLLALNATIEAARAGEAGKGFAVVATEVKNLASQTDKSIQDIERVINEMSHATDGVVTALSGIKSAVDKIYETSSGIAAAVEEQSTTVNDVVKNIQVASNGTVLVTQNIQEVTELSNEASLSSQQVLMAANDLTTRAEQLDMEVAAFLSEVRG